MLFAQLILFDLLSLDFDFIEFDSSIEKIFMSK